ncbi:hypothetical protein NXY56_002143 [Leishmania guyanensis]|uniref:Uncharacterized protein n=1 Tax=Leishmania guyanensis TaxID=5670 RepID=A0A1E1ISJ4_LEIGU|nr:hypothetical protein, conserved [Leishmania guyanensis]
MTDQRNALVIWGSTGRRLQFSMQDLRMPESLRDNPHFHFYERQWGTVASFWFNRILKESSLQHLAVEDIVGLIQEDISKRWKRRRDEQSIYKKRKRLLQGSGSAGAPSSSVLLTNFATLSGYQSAAVAEQRDLVTAVVERVECITKERVQSWRVLVDDASEQQFSKAARVESTAATPEEQANSSAEVTSDFDDRVAVALELSSKEKAATAIAHLHGSRFDGRRVLCQFWSEP